MNLINKVIVCVFSVTLLSSTLLGGGLLWSDNDLAVWRDRAVNGPYKSAGDSFDPLIPGEWDRIVQNKNTFVSNPQADRKSTYWTGTPPAYTFIDNHIDMADAAFYALVKDDTNLAISVKNELMWHANEAGLQISPTYRHVTDDGTWSRAEWIGRLIGCADFVKDQFSEGERATFDAWISDWAYSYEYSINIELNCFANRYSRDYLTGLSTVAVTEWANKGKAYRDSSNTDHWPVAAIARYYNNRRASCMHMVGHAGVWLNDSVLKDRGMLFFEEWIQFSVYPDGAVGEFYRGDSSNPDRGINYLASVLKAAVSVAEALRLSGDSSLYDFSSSYGIFGSNCTTEPPKTLKLVVETYIKLISGDLAWYLDGTTASESTRINGVNGSTQWVNEIFFAPLGNRYWKDDYIKQGYMRTLPGSIAYSSPIGTAGPIHVWGGNEASFPSCLFLFAEMEDVETGTVTPPVTPPTGPVYPQGYREATVGGQLVFGLDPAWSAGREFEAVFDGDPSTFYDYKNGDETFVGIDLGESTLVQALHYHPRMGLENRMVGGRFEGSNESSVSGYETIQVIATEPSAAAQVINLDPAPAYRYYRYLAPAGGYGNISEFSLEFPVLAPEVDTDNLPDEWEIQYFGGINVVNGGEAEDFDGDGSSNYDEWQAGTDPSNATDFPVVTPPVGIVYPDGYREAMLGGLLRFGLDPAWSVGSEFGKVFDGDPSTYYDYINGAGGFAGMDLGESRVVAAINFQPRSGHAKRMVGGRFEGSNESSVSGYETIHVIATEPSSTAQSVDVSSGMAYRYYRYLSPANGFGNIAEFSLELQVVVADSDNLPDAWEVQYFGGINAVNGGETEDFDGDGSSNYDEWLAGTDPSDATDLLELKPVVGVSWKSVRDRAYEIDYSDNNWKTFVTSETLLGGGGPMVWIDPSDGNLIHKRQYRIQVVTQ